MSSSFGSISPSSLAIPSIVVSNRFRRLFLRKVSASCSASCFRNEDRVAFSPVHWCRFICPLRCGLNDVEDASVLDEVVPLEFWIFGNMDLDLILW